MKTSILIAFITIILLGCSNDDDSSLEISVLYNQTYCADPWINEDDEGLEDKINSFFEGKSIEISNLTIDNNGNQELCNACTCLSGGRIVLIVSREDLDNIKEYGFKEFN